MSSTLWRRYPLAVPCGVAAVLLVGALGRWPYGYYRLLRLVTCAAAAYGAYVSYSVGRMGWLWAFVLVAVVFNPIIPLHLSRQIWLPIDLLTAALCVTAIFVVARPGTGAQEAPRSEEEDEDVGKEV